MDLKFLHYMQQAGATRSDFIVLAKLIEEGERNGQA